jgi:hypothetical protein
MSFCKLDAPNVAELGFCMHVIVVVIRVLIESREGLLLCWRCVHQDAMVKGVVAVEG